MLLTTTYETETDYSQLPIDTILIILRFVDIPTGPQTIQNTNNEFWEYGYFQKDQTRHIERIFNFYELMCYKKVVPKFCTGAEECTIFLKHDNPKLVSWMAERVQKIWCNLVDYRGNSNQLLGLLNSAWPKNVRFHVSFHVFVLQKSPFLEIVQHPRVDKINVSYSFDMDEESRSSIIEGLLCTNNMNKKIELSYSNWCSQRTLERSNLPSIQFLEAVGPFIEKVYGFKEFAFLDYISEYFLPSLGHKKNLEIDTDFLLYLLGNNLWCLLDAEHVKILGILRADTILGECVRRICSNPNMKSFVLCMMNNSLDILHNGVKFIVLEVQKQQHGQWVIQHYATNGEYEPIVVQEAVQDLERLINN